MGVTFVHGMGRDGSAVWPLQAAARRPTWRFLERIENADRPAVDGARIASLGDGALVAASYGGLAASLAAESGQVEALVLFEPACFDVARGAPAVEAHIEAMTPAFAVARDPGTSAFEFARLFATGMGLPTPGSPDDVDEVMTHRLRASPAPWTVDIPPDIPMRVPTLVVTGGWNDIYEQTADVLERFGARRETLAGHDHRPQDHVDSIALIDEFLREHHRSVS